MICSLDRGKRSWSAVQPSSYEYVSTFGRFFLRHQWTVVSERMVWNAACGIPDGSELAVCRREGDAKAALQRSHERANLSHGMA